MLVRRVERTSQWTTERKLTIHRARGFHAFGLSSYSHEGDGSNPLGFKDIGEHTNGARADWSDRGEEDDIDAVVA